MSTRSTVINITTADSNASTNTSSEKNWITLDGAASTGTNTIPGSYVLSDPFGMGAVDTFSTTTRWKEPTYSIKTTEHDHHLNMVGTVFVVENYNVLYVVKETKLYVDSSSFESAWHLLESFDLESGTSLGEDHMTHHFLMYQLRSSSNAFTPRDTVELDHVRNHFIYV